MQNPAKIHTISADSPFLLTLADWLLKKLGSNPEQLAETTVFLPTRRACRNFRQILAEHARDRPLFLPNIIPLGDVEEEFALTPTQPILPPVGNAQRLWMMAELVQKFHAGSSIVQATRLSRELLRLLDEIQREQLEFSQLENLVPESLAAHWQRTTDFLKILSNHWPQLLASQGKMDVVEHRNLLVAQRIQSWQQQPPSHPVIAAGSTGSVKSTAQLLHAITKLPRGVVILPGLDLQMSSDVWEKLEPSHPQYTMKNLLDYIDIKRDNIPEITNNINIPRLELLRTALCAPEESAKWEHSSHQLNLNAALHGISYAQVETLEEESHLIALKLREILENPDKTAALVTHNRTLSRMVAAQLQRWGVQVDDSAGKPLLSTAAGNWFCWIMECVASSAAPITLLSLLKHPFTLLGYEAANIRALARECERLCLRGPRPSRGIESIIHLANQAKASAPLLEVLELLQSHFAPLFHIASQPQHRLIDWIDAHVKCAEFLRGEAPEDEALNEIYSSLEQWKLALPHNTLMEPAQFPALCEEMLAQSVFRPAYGSHPQLSLLSPQEARFLIFDRIILADLNEGSWPPAPPPQPWMSLAMQEQFGLTQAQIEMGQAAHDFAQLAACAPEVILTRANRHDDGATIQSRYISRLQSLISISSESLPRCDALDWLTPPMPSISPAQKPAPTPPKEARPRDFSASDIEQLAANPYAYYAKRILHLRELPPIDQSPDALEFGNMLHQVLEDFVKQFPVEVPDVAAQWLNKYISKLMQQYEDKPGVQIFWQSRLESIARHWPEFERQRRVNIRRIYVEQEAEFKLPSEQGEFHIRLRADRLEEWRNGQFCVVDYKAGATPASGEIRAGIRSQLPINAAGLQKQLNLSDDWTRWNLDYWGFGDRTQLPKIKELSHIRDIDWAHFIPGTLEKVVQMLALYSLPETAYRVAEDEDLRSRYHEYAHLQRHEEWA